MIGQETDVDVVDNSGPKKVKCFRILGGTRRRYAGVGDVIIAAVQETEANAEPEVKKGKVVRCVIVQTKSYIKRKDGSKLRFRKNACVLIDEKGNPRGTRIRDAVAEEVRRRGYVKICSLAPEVV